MSDNTGSGDKKGGKSGNNSKNPNKSNRNNINNINKIQNRSYKDRPYKNKPYKNKPNKSNKFNRPNKSTRPNKKLFTPTHQTKSHVISDSLINTSLFDDTITDMITSISTSKYPNDYSSSTTSKYPNDYSSSTTSKYPNDYSSSTTSNKSHLLDDFISPLNSKNNDNIKSIEPMIPHISTPMISSSTSITPPLPPVLSGSQSLSIAPIAPTIPTIPVLPMSSTMHNYYQSPQLLPQQPQYISHQPYELFNSSNLPSNLPSNLSSYLPSNLPSNLSSYLPSNLPSNLSSNLPTAFTNVSHMNTNEKMIIDILTNLSMKLDTVMIANHNLSEYFTNINMINMQMMRIQTDQITKNINQCFELQSLMKSLDHENDVLKHKIKKKFMNLQKDMNTLQKTLNDIESVSKIHSINPYTGTHAMSPMAHLSTKEKDIEDWNKEDWYIDADDCINPDLEADMPLEGTIISITPIEPFIPMRRINNKNKKRDNDGTTRNPIRNPSCRRHKIDDHNGILPLMILSEFMNMSDNDDNNEKKKNDDDVFDELRIPNMDRSIHKTVEIVDHNDFVELSFKNLKDILQQGQKFIDDVNEHNKIVNNHKHTTSNKNKCKSIRNKQNQIKQIQTKCNQTKHNQTKHNQTKHNQTKHNQNNKMSDKDSKAKSEYVDEDDYNYYHKIEYSDDNDIELYKFPIKEVELSDDGIDSDDGYSPRHMRDSDIFMKIADDMYKNPKKEKNISPKNISTRNKQTKNQQTKNQQTKNQQTKNQQQINQKTKRSSISSVKISIPLRIISIDKKIEKDDNGLFPFMGKRYSVNPHKLMKLVKPLQLLESMIGMSDVKMQMFQFISNFLHNSKNDGMLNTAIYGGPGIGKTDLGKILCMIYSALEIVPSSKFKLVKASDLIGQYVGQTRQKTKQVIEDANGGVLFIDEVYALSSGSGEKVSYGKECIDTINQELSENRHNLIIIIAGYEREINESFFKVNQGLERRFPFKYVLKEYTKEEMKDIFIRMIRLNDEYWLYKDIKDIIDDNNDAADMDELDNTIIKSKLMKKKKRSETVTDTDIIELFNDMRYFNNCGGDIENLITQIAFVNSARTIGSHPEKHNIFTKEDLMSGLVMFKKQKTQRENEGYLSMFG